MPKSILFVCLGNICRSPIAEGIAKDLARKYSLDITIDSAGTGGWHIGESPCENSIKISKKKNIDISNLRARKLKADDKQKFELVIAMDQSNHDALKEQGFLHVKKLGSYSLENKDIPDPYFFKGFQGFEEVFNMIEFGIKNLFEVEFGKS